MDSLPGDRGCGTKVIIAFPLQASLVDFTGDRAKTCFPVTCVLWRCSIIVLTVLGLGHKFVLPSPRHGQMSSKHDNSSRSRADVPINLASRRY